MEASYGTGRFFYHDPATMYADLPTTAEMVEDRYATVGWEVPGLQSANWMMPGVQAQRHEGLGALTIVSPWTNLQTRDPMGLPGDVLAGATGLIGEAGAPPPAGRWSTGIPGAVVVGHGDDIGPVPLARSPGGLPGGEAIHRGAAFGAGPFKRLRQRSMGWGRRGAGDYLQAGDRIGAFG